MIKLGSTVRHIGCDIKCVVIGIKPTIFNNLEFRDKWTAGHNSLLLGSMTDENKNFWLIEAHPRYMKYPLTFIYNVKDFKYAKFATLQEVELI